VTQRKYQDKPVWLGAINLSQVAILLAVHSVFAGPARSPFDGAPIHYSSAPANDPVSVLQTNLDKGKSRLTFDKKHGYLKSILQHLKVTASSQSLVFSKTSFQRPLISPKAPRAIYFNDDVYIGWVQGGDVIEISSVDPKLGAIFYTIDQEQVERPRFERRFESCMICHSSSLGQRVPGHLLQSIYPRQDGLPLTGTPRIRIDHTTPLTQRWGGWYVTGTHGRQRHLGNLQLNSAKDRSQLNLEQGANLTSLADRFNTDRYLTPHSDIVALMVLEHQAQMHNAITAARYLALRALHDEAEVRDPVVKSAKLSPVTQLRIDETAEDLLRWLLFIDQAKLSDTLTGTSGFAVQFAKLGPRDSADRSLRQFDLKTRLFKYPCSYLIYSPSFDALPAALLDRVHLRLWQILTGKDQSGKYVQLREKDRQAVLEILLATKQNLPAYFQAPADK